MDQKNLGVIVSSPRQADYILGGASSINVIRLIQDWSNYLPGVESQRNKVTDFLDCVTMSALHSIECQLNYLMATNQLSDEALNFFHNNGYIYNGSFCLSERFNAKLNGTDITKGNRLNVVGDGIRRDGLIPATDLPMTDNMTWEEFYSDVPLNLITKAKKALWFVNIQYQWVYKEDFPVILPISPIQVATEVCAGWDSGQVVKKCSDKPLQHATLLYAQEPVTLNWLDLDHYPPFKQKLAPDYEFPLNMEYVVTSKPITLRNGMFGSNVLQLQKDLTTLGFPLLADSDFGNKTQSAVQMFQNKYNLLCDGKAGPVTLAKIKDLLTPKKTILSAIIEVESGGDDNAEGDKTLPQHAYGCLQIRNGVCDDVNRVFNTNYQASDCLGHRNVSVDIWNKYWIVYPTIQTDEDKARTWNGGPGWKKIYFKANKTDKELQYCKNLDVYWTKVKSLL